MSFSIKKSHKFTEQFPNAKESNRSSTNDLLSTDDYLLFNLGENPSSGGGFAQAAPAKAKKGGNYIRPVNSAQADYY